MKLSDQHRKVVTDWLSERCGQMRCFCCGNGKWQVVDLSGIQVGFDLKTTRFHYHEGLPLVYVACEHCAHIVSFAPAIMGIRADQPPAAHPE